MRGLSPLLVEDHVRGALKEDWGRAGDITTAALIEAGTKGRAYLVAREACLLAGLPLAEEAFRMGAEGAALQAQSCQKEGAWVKAGDSLMILEGDAAAILSAERVALNFLSHLSGIATATARLKERISGSGAKICCTRKTTPNLRALEKYAVRMGGGVNHRFGLDDGVLIKDNHIALVGGVAEALRRARRSVGHMVRIEVEVDRLEQLEEALEAGADAILLDNFRPADIKKAVLITKKRALLEASGGITLESAAQIAGAGVDLISSSWITTSAPACDMGLDMDGTIREAHK